MTEREQLEQAITALEAQRAILGDAVVDASIAALHERLATLEPTPPTDQQRKQVTILFADVSGFTAMSETMDAEDVSDVMNVLWERLDRTITEHGGWIGQHVGDAVMALWGAEAAREDDPERAIRAALAIQAELAAFRDDQPFDFAQDGQVDLAMHIGINTGPVLLGKVGTIGEHTAIGDTVNTASRLGDAAPVGRILISHDTYRHVRGVFDVQPLEPIQVKGKAEPIQVYVVQRAKPRAFRKGTRGVEGIETRMIGREAELKLLQDALHLAMGDGERQMVTITGEAGVGKSRLLYEFENWGDLLPEQIYLFKGRASQEMQSMPYALIRDLFAFRFQIQDSDRASVVREKMERGISEALGENEQSQIKAHFVGQLLGFDFSDSPHLQGVLDDAQQLRDRALIYLSDYFKAMAARIPTRILLEDVHWADDSSLDVLNHLALTLPEQRLLIVCLTRPSLFKRRPHWGEGQIFHTRLELRPLSERESRRLVEEILQKVERVPIALCELVVSGAEGNPFYVEELIKMFIEDDVIIKGEERWRVEPTRLTQVRVPPTLTGVLQARLDSLPLEERTIMQRASVVGRRFWDSAVVRISESAKRETGEKELHPELVEGIPNVLAALRSKEMVFRQKTSAFAEAQEYIFKHAILREVTYESVLKRVRRVYHALVAEWLIEQSGERASECTGLIADHLEFAGRTEQAGIYLRRAGEQAAAQFANAEAVTYFSRALALTPETDTAGRYALLLARERVYDLQGKREAQTQDLAVLKELAQVLNDGRKRAEVALRQAHYAEVTGDYPATIVAAQEAICLAQATQDVRGEAAGYRHWGVALRHQGDYEAARTQLERALRIAHEVGDRQGESRSLNNLGLISWSQGDPAGARVYFEQALRTFREIGFRQGEGVVLGNLGLVCARQGDFAGARAYFEQVLRTFREIGDRRNEGRGLENLGTVSAEQGDLAGAKAYFEQSLAIKREIGNRPGESHVLGNLGSVSAEQGDYAGARAYCEESLRIYREIGDRQGEGDQLCNLGLFFHHLGDDGAAREYSQQALLIAREIGNRPGESNALCHLGNVSTAQGDYVGARACYEQSLAIKREIGDRQGEGSGLAHLALLSHHLDDDEAAREYSQQALHIAQDLGHRSNQGTALAYLGHSQAGLGHLAKAADAYRQALDIRRELGQPHLATESLAGRARISLAQGDLPQALAQVEQILSYVESNTPSTGSGHGLDGTDEPFRVYLTCYGVLRANQDPRAGDILSTAHRLLQERAARISDEELRRSFLENVPAHREILGEFASSEQAEKYG